MDSIEELTKEESYHKKIIEQVLPAWIAPTIIVVIIGGTYSQT